MAVWDGVHDILGSASRSHQLAAPCLQLQQLTLYDASEDLPKVKECIRDPAHFKAALGYYWGQFDPNRFGSEEWAAEQAAAWGRDITQPTLYLHGTQDGCHGMTQEQVNRVPDHCGPGSQSELIEGVGHFLMVQRPTAINKRILDFLAA